MSALAFAIGSLGCAAVNDLVFKKFADGRRPVGLYMTIIGIVWGGVFLNLALWSEGGFGAVPAEFWRYALFAGAFSAVANVGSTPIFPTAHLIASGEISGDACTVRIDGYSTDPLRPGDFSGRLDTTKR